MGKAAAINLVAELLAAGVIYPSAADQSATNATVAPAMISTCPTPVRTDPPDLSPPHTEFKPEGGAIYNLRVGRDGVVLSVSLREWHLTPDEPWFKAALSSAASKLTFPRSHKTFTCEMRYIFKRPI